MGVLGNSRPINSSKSIIFPTVIFILAVLSIETITFSRLKVQSWSIKVYFDPIADDKASFVAPVICLTAGGESEGEVAGVRFWVGMG